MGQVQTGTMRRQARWLLLLTLLALVAGSGMWIASALGRGVSGPVFSGIYVIGTTDILVPIALVVASGAIASVATLIATRVPRNVIGWILGGVACWAALMFFLGALLHLIGGEAPTRMANWIGAWTFVPLTVITVVLMFFPDGSLPSPRWRILPWLAVAGPVGWMLAEATRDELGLPPRVLENPFAHAGANRVGNLFAFLFLPALLGTIASLFVRYRRATPGVRQQIKWVAYGGAVEIGMTLALWALSIFSPEAFGGPAVAVGGLVGLITPLALAVAILKYRLYELDRIVSRTLSYVLIAVTLAGVYAGGVIAIQALIPASDDLAVAVSTLAAAALFAPLRRRVQVAVDRRFNRRRYDAQGVIDGFSSRLRTLTEPDVLARDLTATLEQTLAPSAITIWMKA